MHFRLVLALPGLLTVALLVAVAAPTLAHAQQTGDSLQSTARNLFEPIPDGPAVLDDNPYTAEKELLGKTLFFDPRLSASWALSCNSCHNMGLAGADLQPTSIGHGWQRGGRNSPTVLNSAFNLAQFWDGRAEDLAVQAMGPIQDALEMNSTPELVVETLSSMPDYVEMFEAAFPEEVDPVTFENVAIAIEVFETTLLTPDAPFDLFLEGDTGALGETERAGLELFVQRGCVACHGGVNLGGTGYFPFGIVEVPDAAVRPEDDLGRYVVTNVETDKYAFKSPSLRNVELTPPYFHSGTIWSLEDAVRLMGTAQLGADLSDDEVAKITAFLTTLTGEQPVVVYPVMPMISDTTPLPAPMTVR